MRRGRSTSACCASNRITPTSLFGCVRTFTSIWTCLPSTTNKSFLSFRFTIGDRLSHGNRRASVSTAVHSRVSHHRLFSLRRGIRGPGHGGYHPQAGQFVQSGVDGRHAATHSEQDRNVRQGEAGSSQLPLPNIHPVVSLRFLTARGGEE